VTTAIPSDPVAAKPGTRFERALVTVLLLAMIALPAASALARRFLGRDLPGASSEAREKLDAILFRIQNELFNLGSDLATLPGDRHPKQPVVEPHHVAFLEETIDHLNTGLPELTSFVLPGGGLVGAHLHQARTVCRRAERLVTALGRHEAIGDQCLVYLNRLSDLLFVLSRWAAKVRSEPETLWRPE